MIVNSRLRSSNLIVESMPNQVTVQEKVSFFSVSRPVLSLSFCVTYRTLLVSQCQDEYMSETLKDKLILLLSLSSFISQTLSRYCAAQAGLGLTEIPSLCLTDAKIVGMCHQI